MMRVIAGELKGRRLEAVPGKQTRPTSDKVKEATFQMMGPFFNGGRCLDLFAGSGSLGIEAISRGMDYAVFIDKQSKAIHTIYKNIKTMKIEEQTEVARMDAFRALKVTQKNKAKFDRSEEHTSELQSRFDLVCRLLLEKKKDEKQSTT